MTTIAELEQYDDGHNAHYERVLRKILIDADGTHNEHENDLRDLTELTIVEKCAYVLWLAARNGGQINPALAAQVASELERQGGIPFVYN